MFELPDPHQTTSDAGRNERFNTHRGRSPKNLHGRPEIEGVVAVVVPGPLPRIKEGSPNIAAPPVSHLRPPLPTPPGTGDNVQLGARGLLCNADRATKP
jgi:hypothetical protein